MGPCAAKEYAVSTTPLWIPLASVAVGALGLAGVLWSVRGRRARNAEGVLLPRDTIQMPCTRCNRPLVISAPQLVLLSGAEMALAVRGNPHWVRRKIGEADCPHCGAGHLFDTAISPPRYLGANVYLPQASGARCLECSKIMAVAPWPPEEYEGRLHEAPLSKDHGLECQFCKSTFCYECAERVSTQRRKDGLLFCPRCFRQPVANVYKP